MNTNVTNSGVKSLAWVGGVLASLVATAVAVVLAFVFAVSIVVIALIGAALVAFAVLAVSARRVLRPVAAESGPQVLEARNVGGHSWVAYGWDQRS